MGLSRIDDADRSAKTSDRICASSGEKIVTENSTACRQHQLASLTVYQFNATEPKLLQTFIGLRVYFPPSIYLSEKIMNAVICERVTVDQRGAVVLIDPRLNPGDKVEVTVRSIDSPKRASFIETARTLRIDAPANYSVAFEDALRNQA